MIDAGPFSWILSARKHGQEKRKTSARVTLGRTLHLRRARRTMGVRFGTPIRDTDSKPRADSGVIRLQTD